MIGDHDPVYNLWISTPGPGIAQYLKRNPNTCFVALENGEMIGVLLSGHDGRRGYIHHTAVAVSARKRGIGKALLDAAMQALGAEGIHKVALVVFEANETGNRFWGRNGFCVRDDLVYRNKSNHELERMDA